MEHVSALFVEPLTSGWTILESTSTRPSDTHRVYVNGSDTIFAITTGAGRVAIVILRSDFLARSEQPGGRNLEQPDRKPKAGLFYRLVS